MAIEAEDTPLEQLMWKVVTLKEAGYRFLTLTALEVDEETAEIIYHFDINLQMKNLRVRFPKGTKIPSISPIYFAAFWAENEVIDLLGITFSCLKIDYHGTMYLDAEDKDTVKTPFCRYTFVKKEAE